MSDSWDRTARLWDLAGLDEPAKALIARSDEAWGIGIEGAMRGRRGDGDVSMPAGLAGRLTG